MTTNHKIYTGLCVLFTLLVVMSNLVYQKYVYITLPFYRFEVSAAAIFYPLTFLITDLITEQYGKDHTRFCIRFSVAVNVLVVLMICYMDELKATPWSRIDDVAFHDIFGYFGVGFVGTMTANYISRTFDLHFYVALSRLMKEKLSWLRSTFTTIISIFIDTCLIWSILAYLGALPYDQLWLVILNSYSWKLFFTLISAPIFYIAISGLKLINGPKQNNPSLSSILYKPLMTNR